MSDDSEDLKKRIKHGEHLTFVDVLKAGFRPLHTSDELTGRVKFPREEYLTERAAARKFEYDEEQKRLKAQKKGAKPQS
jgi:hypothetical protein